MNEHDSTGAIDTIDLDYAPPMPSPDLADRVRSRARSYRRRRRVGGGAAAIVALAVAIPLGLHLGTGGPAAKVQEQAPAATRTESNVDLPTLPFSTGSDPSITYDENSDVQTGWGPATAPITWTTDDKGNEELIWFSKDNSLCTGERPNPNDVEQLKDMMKPVDGVLPSGCDPLRNAPAEGFWMNSAGSNGELPPDSLEPVDTYILGIVRGPVDRVVVGLPTSGPVEAHLSPAPDDLGTLYWITTRDYSMAGTVVGSDETASRVEHVDPHTITAYRGDTPVFHCENDGCFGPPRQDPS